MISTASRCHCFPVLLGMAAAAFMAMPVSPVRADSPPAKVVVGSKSFTESVILGEMLAHLARASGAVPSHRAELGGTQILWKALLAGEIDVYPEYTGTISEEILRGAKVRDEDDMRDKLARQGVHMSRQLGFNNTYALGMRKDTATRLGVKSISDLRDHPELKIGLSDEFMQRADGWPGLQTRYQLPQKHVRGLDHNLAYRGLQNGSLDVTDLYTTDAEIRYYDLVTLTDDRGYFPTYHAVLLWREDLARKAPATVEAFERLQGRISTEDMVELNSQVRLDHQTEARCAADYLKKKLDMTIQLGPGDGDRGFQRAFRQFLTNTGQHLFLVAVSLAAAVLVAIPLGILAHRHPKTGSLIIGVAGVIQTLPSMALLVFMIPLLGLGAWPAIVALFLYSLLPIIRNTHTGLQAIPPSVRESAEVLGLPEMARLRLVELPLASRSIVSGIKTAAVINVGTATIGALIGAGGYGQPILTGIRLDNVGLILQGAVPAAVLALLVQGGFSLLELVVVPRGLRV